ncbi:MAG: ankyrin repeat domain-containing protein [Candidatus Anstonellales archaeon]
MIGKELIEECDRYRDASVEKVVKLILEGANLNLQEDKNGHTALINASFYNYNEIVEILCKCGANLDLQSYTFGYTALIEAVGEDNKKIVERLLKYGANPFLEDNQGKTAMDWARSKDTKEMLAKHTAEIILDKIDKGKILDEKEEKMKGLALRFTLKECDKRAVKILENII